MKIKKRGFTLIELLVVIAIIGILSAVVLASLNAARSKGKDASAQASMEAMRSAAALYYNGPGNGTFGSEPFSPVPYTSTSVSGVGDFSTDSLCSSPDLVKLGIAVAKQVPGGVGAPTCATTWDEVSGTTVTTFTIVTQFNDGTYFCVDQTGFAGKVNDPYGANPDGFSLAIHCKS